MNQAATVYKPSVISLDVIFNGVKTAYQFQKSVISIGRDEECDIPLKTDSRASRLHAELRWNLNLLELHNISAKNYVTLNGKVVQVAVLKNKDIFKIGDTEFYLAINQPEKVVASPFLKSNHQNPPLTFKQNLQQHNKASPRAIPILKKETHPIVVILIILLVGFIGWNLLKSNTKKNSLNLRSQEEIIKDIERSEMAVKELEKKQEDSGKTTVQYKMAQEQYIKGFRDYRQGQYARAIQSFQAALSFYPQHQLAAKYMAMSRRKFDELIDFNLVQGHKYLSKNNFRLCKSSFANVMIMVKDPSDAKYKEGKQFYSECSAKLEDKY